MQYNFDVERLIKLLLPSFLRRARQVTWLRMVLTPLVRLKGEFLGFVEQTRYLLTINGQVTVLQMHLNNRFDFAQKRIVIVDTALAGDNFIWFGSEGQAPDFVRFRNESNIYSLFLGFANEEVSSEQYDFNVLVPTEYELIEPQLRAVIERYKLAGKRYQIIYI